jgi:hypothetical protein
MVKTVWRVVRLPLTVVTQLLLLWLVYRLAGADLAGYALSGLALMLTVVSLVAPERPRAVLLIARWGLPLIVLCLAARLWMAAPLPQPARPVNVGRHHVTPILPLLPPVNAPREMYPVSVMSWPTNAAIYANGVFVGLGDRQIDLPAGRHVIRISKSGFEDSIDVVVTPRERLLTVRLKPKGLP